MKNHSRNFNKLVSGLTGDREIRFELISADQPMDSRRTLHRHECHQLRIHIPTDSSAPVDVEVVYPRVCHPSLKRKDYDSYYIWLLDMEMPDFSYPYNVEGTFNPKCFSPLLGALDRLRASGVDDLEARRDCLAQLVEMVRGQLRPEVNDPVGDTKVRWLIRRFRNHYYRRELSVMREAKYAGISPNYVQKVFFSVTHQTPKAFLTQVRMEAAARFLNERRYPVKQVAVMCGFKDEAYFSNTFRAYYGCAPGRFAKSAAPTAGDTASTAAQKN